MLSLKYTNKTSFVFVRLVLIMVSSIFICFKVIVNLMYFCAICHLGIEMSDLKARLMLDNLKSELNNFKMEVYLEMKMHRVKQTD